MVVMANSTPNFLQNTFSVNSMITDVDRVVAAEPSTEGPMLCRTDFAFSSFEENGDVVYAWLKCST